MTISIGNIPPVVIPVKTGIHGELFVDCMDSGLRRNDRVLVFGIQGCVLLPFIRFHTRSLTHIAHLAPEHFLHVLHVVHGGGEPGFYHFFGA